MGACQTINIYSDHCIDLIIQHTSKSNEFIDADEQTPSLFHLALIYSFSTAAVPYYLALTKHRSPIREALSSLDCIR